ncbi:hypothetical protein JCM19235_2650 [Vibrio maritimus]|uniref:YHS domain-containing protein n=1 Tax=Vibrio maritimus TaxID=990268 RepID=A0A090SIE5_9VIBR|nr:hypothetical protein JCM19235_2650 [Vibrio maritimus]
MKLFRLALPVFLWLALTATAHAVEPVYSDFFGKAIRGYDPVAYFTEGKPVKGDSDYTYSWNDAEWYFSSQENLSLFTANPEKYAPQYGGYCAWAVSKAIPRKSIPMHGTYITTNCTLIIVVLFKVHGSRTFPAT